MDDFGLISGSGVGMPLGTLNSDALVTVAKESCQPAGTIKYGNIFKIWRSMPEKLRTYDVWYINQEIVPQLYTMALNIGTGGASTFQYSTLLDRPIIQIKQCSVHGKKDSAMLAALPIITTLTFEAE